MPQLPVWSRTAFFLSHLKALFFGDRHEPRSSGITACPNAKFTDNVFRNVMPLQDIVLPFSFFSTVSAASLPVNIETGSPEGLKVHWPH